ncbi:MAG: ArdC family protein, partial [Gammaproteobacteria bacterium]|nr:ArdC family protein [Gammaproteobacteria bacterium]
ISFIRSIPVNVDGSKYRGINAFYLNFMRYMSLYDSNKWITPNKVKYLKGKVKTDANPSLIIYYNNVSVCRTPPVETVANG